MLKLTHTKDYLLLIDSEAKIKEGDYFLNIVQKEIYHNHIKNYNTNKYYLKLIIGYYLLREGVEELNLPLLPNPFENVEESSFQILKDLVENVSLFFGAEVANKNSIIRRANKYMAGYNTAQAKQFSLEDMKKAISMARLMVDNGVEEEFDTEAISGLTELCTYGLRDKYSEEEIIQSLSTKKYPKEFIMEEVETNSPIPQFKTIRNIEGKFVIQGTYKW